MKKAQKKKNKKQRKLEWEAKQDEEEKVQPKVIEIIKPSTPEKK